MRLLRDAVGRMGLGVGLIVACAAVLLLSDLSSRQQPQTRGVPRVAFFKYATTPILDDVERGVFQALGAKGFGSGTMVADRFSADSDMGTAALIAKNIVQGRYTIAITASTVALQVLARANAQGAVPHVFGAVTDPVGAGVGIEAFGSLRKPAHLTGAGTFQPVSEAFQLARAMRPSLRSVGAVWTPAESNSEACVKRARAVSQTLGITLLEATVEKTSDVQNAAEALVARGAEALWGGCDTLVSANIQVVARTAAKAGIPLFSQRAGDVALGTLFDLGADYVEVGRIIGGMAAGILNGARPDALPVANVMPQRLLLNERVRAALHGAWTFPDDVVATAESRVTADGREERLKQPATDVPRFGRTWHLHLVKYSESVPADEAEHGIELALQQAGLRPGVDFTLTKHSAQGDMATLPVIMDATLTARADAVIVLSTPTLQAALQKITLTPIVFTFVADPFILKAARTDTDHLPNLTGVYTVGPYREMTELLTRHFPTFKRVGTLFTPAEVNSVYNKDLFTAEARKAGIEVEAVAVQTATEMADAGRALASRRIDAIIQIVDNLSAAGFSSVSQAALSRKLPLFSFTTAALKQGAALSLSRDYEQSGREAGEKLLQVMSGESPARIPLSPPRVTKLVVSEENAARLGLALPADLLKNAGKLTGGRR